MHANPPRRERTKMCTQIMEAAQEKKCKKKNAQQLHTKFLPPSHPPPQTLFLTLFNKVHIPFNKYGPSYRLCQALSQLVVENWKLSNPPLLLSKLHNLFLTLFEKVHIPLNKYGPSYRFCQALSQSVVKNWKLKKRMYRNFLKSFNI